ncbi:unnamed protein product [Tilletia controversa]|nr:unnamed protein product [Tilletia controversa]
MATSSTTTSTSTPTAASTTTASSTSSKPSSTSASSSSSTSSKSSTTTASSSATLNVFVHHDFKYPLSHVKHFEVDEHVQVNQHDFDGHFSVEHDDQA